MAPRRNSVRRRSDRPPAASPPIRTSPPSGRSSSPAMCSNVDLPEPDGPTKATISPRATASVAPRSTARRLPPWTKVRSILSRARTASAALFIAQRLDRIEPRRAPRRIERGQERQPQGAAADRGHVPCLDDRRQLRQEIELVREQRGSGELLQPLANRFDVLGESQAEAEPQRRADDADA